MEKDNLHHEKFAGQCSAVTPRRSPSRARASRDQPLRRLPQPRVVTTHVPPGMPLACTQCHEPHGTDNIRLVRDVIHTPGRSATGRSTSTTLTGFADGSFASPSAPGTGLCEVCHTQTQFYRADGTGAPHPTLQCITCHRHEAGFSPQ